MPSKDNVYNDRKGIGFENTSYFEKAKDLRPTLYDEKVIGLGYTLTFLTHSDEALEIEKFKRSRENKIELAYDYGNLNANEVVNLLEKEKVNLETIESLKSKSFESSEKVCSKLENQSENDCLVIEKECDKEENPKMIAPGIFKLNVSQCVSPISIKGIGFENLSYFEKAKDLRPTLYDEKVIGLGYTLMFLTHSNEALEIEKFKRSRENKIEFANDYENLNASYVNVKINFGDDYFQEIINPDFEKINSLFQQTSSLKLYVPNKKGSSNTSNVGLSAVNVSNLIKNVKQYSHKDLLACNNSHLGETSSAYMCNDAMNVFCDSRMNDLLDDNNFFVFDDESVKMSPVSKMPF
nr:hypothetical protein [Tanacetum cinerariifolium]